MEFARHFWYRFLQETNANLEKFIYHWCRWKKVYFPIKLIVKLTLCELSSQRSGVYHLLILQSSV